MPLSTAVSIRRMERRDLEQAAKLAGQLGYPTSLMDLASRFKRVSTSTEDYLCVADTSTLQTAGWIHLHLTRTLESEPQVEVFGLIVDERARRSGVGRALMEEAERWARERGVATVRLRSNIVRKEAHAFYETLGYRIVKTQYAFEKRV
jgi:GNAT superfamily N-acetyltransferase